VAEEGRVQMKGGEVESVAMLIGELAEVVVHELQKSKPSLSKTGNEVNGKVICKPQKSKKDSRGLAISAPHSYTFTKADVSETTPLIK
jgi:predicted transcriptional regulator YheO